MSGAELAYLFVSLAYVLVFVRLRRARRRARILGGVLPARAPGPERSEADEQCTRGSRWPARRYVIWHRWHA
jgi:hypothetical protein